MAKTSFWRDEILGELLELGQSTAKKSVQQVGKTFSPLKILEGALGYDSNNSLPEKKNNQELKKTNNTPLNLEKLQQKYYEQDKQKEEFLRQRLFQLVKRGDEEVLQREKQKEEERKRMEFYQGEEKKRKEERKRQEASLEAPRGKIRRSIFSPKKVAQRQQAEIKPAAGKQ